MARSLRAPVPWQLPGLAAYIAERTEFFDDALLRACRSSARQVVVVGAGYDARSLRFRQPGVTFFELDHPATQTDKLTRLNQLGVNAQDVRFVPADLGHDSVADALAAAGQDPTDRTHFMCEGLTSYLLMADLADLLRSLAARAGPGSTLAIDFAQPGRRHTGASRLLLAMVRAGTAAMGERIVTLLTAGEAETLLTETGWPHVELSPWPGTFPVIFALASTRSD